MPLTVVTLKKVPLSLRGDLTKWMQEISSGVYVGNFNSKIREKLWCRVKENVKDGEATLSYADRNEIGYKFETWKTIQKAVDYDGIPLVYIPTKQIEETENLLPGYSCAAKFHKIRNFTAKKPCREKLIHFIVVDFLFCKNRENEWSIQQVDACRISLKMTTKEVLISGMLSEKEIKNQTEDKSWRKFLHFVGKDSIVIYDSKKLKTYIGQEKKEKGKILNRIYDLQNYVKREKVLMDYSFFSACKAYGLLLENDNKKTKMELLAKITSKLNVLTKQLEKEKA